MDITIFIAIGFLAALITRTTRGSIADLMQGMALMIPTLIVSIYSGMALGIMSAPSVPGWLSILLPSTGILTVIVGPIVFGLFFGLWMLVISLASYYAMVKIKP